MSLPKLRNVSTSFLMSNKSLLLENNFGNYIKSEANKFVLLLQRSSLVSTFKNHWAGVSGSFEGNETALQTALREIKEETGLESLTLIRKGNAMNITDKINNMIWVVHPFLFEVNSLQGFTLDWEHDKFRWVDSWKVGIESDYQYVPHLANTFWRCNFPDEIQADIKALRLDRSHGAAEIALMAVELLQKAVYVVPFSSTEHIHQYLIEFARALAYIRKSMAPVRNALDWLLNDIVKNGLPKSREEFIRSVNISVSNYKKQEDLSHTEVEMNLLSLLTTLSSNTKDNKRIRILLHSYSSTLARALNAASNTLLKKLSVFITESRPLCEGVKTAAFLNNHPLCAVTLITDAQSSIFIPECDVVLLGADTVLSDGTLVNKSGSCLIALAANYYKVPVYVICKTDKYLSSLPSKYFELEEPDTDEITSIYSFLDRYRFNSSEVEVRNVYFDKTPLELINAFVTDKGIIDREQLLSVCSKLNATDLMNDVYE